MIPDEQQWTDQRDVQVRGESRQLMCVYPTHLLIKSDQGASEFWTRCLVFVRTCLIFSQKSELFGLTEERTDLPCQTRNRRERPLGLRMRTTWRRRRSPRELLRISNEFPRRREVCTGVHFCRGTFVCPAHLPGSTAPRRLLRET